jgi:hypothetical protein
MEVAMQRLARFGSLVAALALCGFTANTASAALSKYNLNVFIQLNDPDVSPNPSHGIPQAGAVFSESSLAVLGSAGPNPVLRRFVYATDQTTTTNVPALSLTIFVSALAREGPDVANQIHGNPVASFTGTGSTNAGSTTRWGVVTGWTLSGSTYCQATPAVVCSLAMLQDHGTVDGRFNSNAYDLGTWYFHGTGFTSTPFIRSYSTRSLGGNTTFFVRGFRDPDGTVPALPLLGIALLGASLVAGGATAFGRRRDS